MSACPSSLQTSSYISLLTRKTATTEATPSEAEIVALAAGGDEDAFAELYLRHRRHVYFICIRGVRNPSLAEELTQETFLQLHRKIATFRGESAFSTWLHRMAVNTVMMHVRKRSLTLISLDELVADVPEERGRRQFGTTDLRQSGAIDRVTIERAVACLPPGYRAVFEFHDVQGFGHQEIATKLNCTAGCSKSQLHQARRKLRTYLQPASR